MRFQHLLWWRKRKGDYERTFSADHGRRVLKDIYRENMLGAETHVAGDPYTSAFNAGRRRAALTIARALNETESEFIARLQIAGDEEYGEEG